MDQSVDPRFSDLLARLYSGVEAERPWEDFLEALAGWLGSTFATLIIAAPGTRLPGTFVTPGANPEFSAAYINSFFADDPFQGLPEGRVTSFGEFIAGQTPDRFAAYREYLRLAGGEQVLAVDLRFGGRFEARFRATRSDDYPAFTMEDRQRFQLLVPHLRIAINLFEKLQFAGAQHGVFRSAAEGLGLALLVLDRQMRLVSSNALAEKLLNDDEAIRRGGDGIIRIDDAALRGRIREMLLAGSTSEAVARFRIARPDHGDLIATARTIDLPAIHSGTGALALFLAAPARDRAPPLETIREVLGITTAEARLCATLAQGGSLIEAAQQLNIAHNTAKAQLRSVFAKTGIKRQSQLMTLLATLTS